MSGSRSEKSANPSCAPAEGSRSLSSGTIGRLDDADVDHPVTVLSVPSHPAK